ncbi:hypothetical protein [Actinokineospora diospyrosa]|uniref:Secreted protein n=1 Tax=Actinokineospora diospyrosa TaxID=103728 RepID=A0ABT1IB02_9PSEU|nr:hypothetical protein [Actinokineospora diospyrosa]MCP2269721.1 hypothetical protein [Actinokineospora diospyrosa]
MFKSLALALLAVLAVAVPATASPTGLSYSYRYPLALETDISMEALTAAVSSDLRQYFPFDSNCAVLPPIGGLCYLYTPPGLPLPGTTNPVQVIDRTANSWTFLSLPGHTEGAGRSIVFSFESEPTPELRVRAGGPFTFPAAATIYSGAANAIWLLFATNISAAW